jgi:hypothetical protein
VAVPRVDPALVPAHGEGAVERAGVERDGHRSSGSEKN